MKNQKIWCNMTAMELNAQIWRDMAEIADSESLLQQLAKYLKKLVKEKAKDPSLMTKEEFFARVDEAKKGKSHRMNPDENLTDFLKRNGYEV